MKLTQKQARALWLQAQRLDRRYDFGKGASAVEKVVSHLGYVQIDTIHVIERCHHHILYSRLPEYRRRDLQRAQSQDKSVFEYWTHALSYVPVTDYRFFVADMKAYKTNPGYWGRGLEDSEKRKVRRLLQQGPLSIRDIKDDVLVEKQHLWASRKPSKRALQYGFYCGDFVVSERVGMLKKYDLAARHFAWTQNPRAATEREYVQYLIARGLRSQGLVNPDSLCYLLNGYKKTVLQELERKTKTGELIEVQIENSEKNRHWMAAVDIPQAQKFGPRGLASQSGEELTHILSPFDPLVIQRKRLKQFFDYEHIFEAYVPPAKRKFGYFTLPVLIGDEVVALLDLKTDREAQKVRIQNWVWRPRQRSKQHRLLIENELDRFERFQLAAE